MTDTKTVADRTGELMETAFNLAENHLQAKAIELADPRDGTKAHFAVSHEGLVPVAPGAWDAFRPSPLHRSGTAALTQLQSFIDLVNRFKFPHSAIFASDDSAKPSLTAIFDYHPDNGEVGGELSANAVQARRHKASYAFPLSKEWQAWIGKNAKPMGMGDFARFIEDNIVDVSADQVESFAKASQDFVSANRGTLASPSKLVEISRGLQVYERAVIKEAKNLSTGEAQFTFDSEHTDGDGKPLTLPTMFSITIPVFARSTDVFRLIARFRYRKTSDGLLFWYELWRPDLTFETAFNEAIEEVGSKTGLPIFVGAPE
ncbi:DUF2303 family protein [Sphingobium sp. TCM1]|uniref:DUF2303 family protein n=1 Tax=Sphingobium sp. TCM1 TaxID=453246 RepID=UPI0007F54988|nr:DUF2303 family protein [Sphingobium sp. TCM1]OAN52822.1 hypothetical protein A7Q26_06400 [Sphingobium sp. TCM1]